MVSTLASRSTPILIVLFWLRFSCVLCQPPNASKSTDVNKPVERPDGIKIAAIGDSFTEGWAPTPAKKFPYTDYVSNCLTYRTGGKTKLQIENKGYGWASVVWAAHNLTDTTISFIDASVKAGVKYDWIIVWSGGVNDFSNAKFTGSPDQVLAETEKIYDAALAAGWGVLVMPQVSLRSLGRTATAELNRQKFVVLLKEYIRKQNNAKLQYLDLEALGLDGWNMTQQDVARYFDRNLHFSEIGYDRVGQLVCDFMTAYVRGQPLTNISYSPMGVNYTSESKPASTKSSSASLQLPHPLVLALAALLMVVGAFM